MRGFQESLPPQVCQLDGFDTPQALATARSSAQALATATRSPPPWSKRALNELVQVLDRRGPNGGPEWSDETRAAERCGALTVGQPVQNEGERHGIQNP